MIATATQNVHRLPQRFSGFADVDTNSGLSYADEEESKYHTPPMENSTPLPVLPPCCQRNTLMTGPFLGEIEEETGGPIVRGAAFDLLALEV